MSEITNPISTAFEVQRNTIEQGQKAVEGTVALQGDLNQAFLGSMASQKDLGKRGVEISRTTVHTYLDTVSSLSPSTDSGAVDEIRTTVDEQYDALLSSHEEAFDAISAELENGVESYDELLAENLNIYSDQIEAFLESHEELEAQTEQAQQQFTEQAEEIQEQFEQLHEQLTENVEEQATTTENS